MNVHEYQAKELLRPTACLWRRARRRFTRGRGGEGRPGAARARLGGEVADPRRRARQGHLQGGRGRHRRRRAARQVHRRGEDLRRADAGQDAGDGPDRARRPRRQAALHRGRHRDRARALPLRPGGPGHLAHLVHRLHRRRHGHREGGARHARQDRHAVDRPGLGLSAVPRPQDRLRPEAGRRPDRPVREADRGALSRLRREGHGAARRSTRWW